MRVDTRIYDFVEERISKDPLMPYEYLFECSYDPSGKALGKVHIHRRETPFTAKKWVFQVLGPKNKYYYVAHYSSEKYEENMKKYKEGKIKARPNGSKPCYIGTLSKLGQF